MSLSFGTDGVRGVANSELTPELVLALGRAAARVLAQPIGPAPFLVGRDTRISGPLLQAALTAGLASEGVDVADAGVIPTPGLARLAETQETAGAMISASHNPFVDNGIKLFAQGGRKLSDETEKKLEVELTAILDGSKPAATGTGFDVGRAARLAKGPEWYAEQLVEALEGRDLRGLRVVIDCANGAAVRVAPEALERAGADVEVINDRPDGLNINEGCGSTHPEGLQKAVVEFGAQVGLAFDGDADRVLAVDHTGRLVDGDHMLALCALDMRERGELVDDTVVITVMTNLGFRKAMAEHGIRIVETKVGDRYVLEALEEGGFSLGGEQSGHVIFPELATSGDGILTGLKLLDVIVRNGKDLADLSDSAMTRLPQVLRSIRVDRLSDLEDASEVWEEVSRIEAELGDDGRLLLRTSGTEPLIRVMAEATSSDTAHQVVSRMCNRLEQVLGSPKS